MSLLEKEDFYSHLNMKDITGADYAQAKEDFEKDFFKFMNAKKCRDIKLFTTDRRRNYWVSEPNYHTSKPFTEHLLAIEMKNQTKILINKPVYLGLSIL